MAARTPSRTPPSFLGGLVAVAGILGIAAILVVVLPAGALSAHATGSPASSPDLDPRAEARLAAVAAKAVVAKSKDAAAADPILEAAPAPSPPRQAAAEGDAQRGQDPAARTVRACMLDSGVRATHEEIAGYLDSPLDLTRAATGSGDDLGHGTGVASRIVAGYLDAGGAPGGLRILSVKVLEPDSRYYWSVVAAALRTCQHWGADVVTMSIGAETGDTAVEATLRDLRGDGIVLVAAAGNSGPCDACVMFPARYDSVLAVACLEAGTDQPCADAASGPEVDLAAPGGGIRMAGTSSDTAHVRASGSSFAAPYAAGRIAAMQAQAEAPLGPAAILDHAVDIGASGRDARTGAGRLA